MALAAAILVCGCRVTIISGPSTVSVGETVTYVLELDATGSLSVDSMATVVVDVPEGWSFESSTYSIQTGTGTVVGDGTVVTSDVCNSTLGEVRPGFRRWHVAGDTLSAPSGRATLVFFVESQPVGEFNLFFAFGGFNFSDCGTPSVLTINREGAQFLTLVQSLFDGDVGVDGLDGPEQMALAPDGRHLYVASRGDRAVTAFSRDQASGELTLIEVDSEAFDGLAEPGGLAISADGRDLYGASPSLLTSGGITTFSRDEVSGELLFLESIFDDVSSIVLSPTGDHVYAASRAINLYSRDEVSGELSFVETIFSGGRLAMSPDGRHVYAAGNSGSTIDIYRRDGTSGKLTLAGGVATSDGLSSASQVAISPCGQHLYVTGRRAITVFERHPMTDELSFVESQNEITGGVFDFVVPASLAISPDGSHVVAGGEKVLSVFQRDKATGTLDFVETTFAGNLPVAGLPEPDSLVFSPDGRYLYAINRDDDALLAFESAILFFDGFESGTTSAWSSETP